MKLCRVQWRGETHFGRLADGRVHFFTGPGPIPGEESGRSAPLEECRLLAPVEPGKIVAVGKNYRAHVRELSGLLEPEQKEPERPLLFLKPSTSVIGPGEAIVCPPGAGRVDYEAELGVVIGRRVKNLPPERFAEAVLGYVCLNDVTARDLQKSDGQWTRAKGFDTFCPIGPWVETELDPFCATVRARLNGAVRQEESTAAMIFPVDQLIGYISSIMTLLPGDVIATGTPVGVAPLAPGDEIQIEIDGIGTLTNPVRAGE